MTRTDLRSPNISLKRHPKEKAIGCNQMTMNAFCGNMKISLGIATDLNSIKIIAEVMMDGTRKASCILLTTGRPNALREPLQFTTSQSISVKP